MNDLVTKTRNCRRIAVPGVTDMRGRLNFIEVGKGLPFKPLGLFWLHLTPDQWRVRYGHRQSELVLIALQGACRVRLDDGGATDEVMLDDPGKALYVGSWVWHELVNMGTQSTILAITSTLDDEGAYLHDYETFKREALARP